jgi:hypothetical protein
LALVATIVRAMMCRTSLLAVLFAVLADLVLAKAQSLWT